MGVLNEDWLRKLQPEDLSRIFGGLLGGSGPPLPRTAPLPPRRPSELMPMQIQPEQRQQAEQQLRQQYPYGFGTSEKDAQPGGDTFPVTEMRDQVGGSTTPEEEDKWAANYARMNTDATRKLPREYRPSVEEKDRMRQLLQHLRQGY